MALQRQVQLEAIKEQLIHLAKSIEADKTLRHQDVCIEIESFFRDLLNLAYGWQLENANTLFCISQDSFDLVDET
jgi:hypothetical protein